MVTLQRNIWKFTMIEAIARLKVESGVRAVGGAGLQRSKLLSPSTALALDWTDSFFSFFRSKLLSPRALDSSCIGLNRISFPCRHICATDWKGLHSQLICELVVIMYKFTMRMIMMIIDYDGYNDHNDHDDHDHWWCHLSPLFHLLHHDALHPSISHKLWSFLRLKIECELNIKVFLIWPCRFCLWRYIATFE